MPAAAISQREPAQERFHNNFGVSYSGCHWLSERTNRNYHHESSIASGASAVWDSLALDDASSRHEHWLRSR